MDLTEISLNNVDDQWYLQEQRVILGDEVSVYTYSGLITYNNKDPMVALFALQSSQEDNRESK